jgi:glutaredoxin
MMTLYVKDGCPYCEKVMSAASELGIKLETKNVADAGVTDELIARGGRKQEPYLVDHENKKEMYDSDAIVAYLKGESVAVEENSGVCKLE